MKELIFKRPQKKPKERLLIATNTKEIKFWKPNLLQRFMYWVGLMKDPRYNGKKTNFYYLDEIAHLG